MVSTAFSLTEAAAARVRRDVTAQDSHRGQRKKRKEPKTQAKTNEHPYSRLFCKERSRVLKDLEVCALDERAVLPVIQPLFSVMVRLQRKEREKSKSSHELDEVLRCGRCDGVEMSATLSRDEDERASAHWMWVSYASSLTKLCNPST